MGLWLVMNQAAREADVAIIGGGPIGLELAAGLKHAGVKYVQFEAGAVGSTIEWWSPGTRFFSSPERIEIAGVPLALVHQDKATREEYLAYLRGVVRQLDLELESYTRVMRIERARDAFELHTQPSTHGVGGPEEKENHDSQLMIHDPSLAGPDQRDARWIVKRIVLAIGNMHRPRMIGVPGETLARVSHYLGEAHTYFGQRVLIVGGKNSAVEAAIRLYRCGATVIMSYRGSEFDPKRIKYWLKPELDWLIGKGLIEFHPRTVVKAIGPLPGVIKLVLVEGDAGADGREAVADSVLLLTGYVQDAALFEQLGVEMAGEDRAPRFDLHTMQTNAPGIYVAGTAAAGSPQRTKLFIENSHVHVRRIVRAIAGCDVPWRSDGDFGALEQ